MNAPADHAPIILHVEIVPQEDGTYGVTFALDGAGGCVRGDATLVGSFTKSVRRIKRELDRITDERQAAIASVKKPARAGRRALIKAKDEGKLDEPTDDDTDKPTDDTPVIVLES